jgi:hypothetical protein
VSLDISHNSIKCLRPLAPLSSLRTLAAAHNAITSLDGIDTCSSLNRLDATGNALAMFSAAAPAAACPLLGALTLVGCPLTRALDYRLHLVHLLPQARTLCRRCHLLVQFCARTCSLSAAAQSIPTCASFCRRHVLLRVVQSPVHGVRLCL